jgi:hypothetical protein
MPFGAILQLVSRSKMRHDTVAAQHQTGANAYMLRLVLYIQEA